MYRFFHLLQENPGFDESLLERAASIESAARESGLTCHREDHGGFTTIQVETNDSCLAITFKLSTPPAADESHG